MIERLQDFIDKHRHIERMYWILTKIGPDGHWDISLYAKTYKNAKKLVECIKKYANDPNNLQVKIKKIVRKKLKNREE